MNATALAACQRFVSHVTGSLTRFAMDYTSLRLVFDYGAVLAAFIVGAMSSYWFLDRRRRRGHSPSVTAPLGLVALTLVVASIGGMLGFFGPFGMTVETNADFILLALLAFAMGLQNASVSTISGMMVRTTHMTGPLTDFSLALGTYVGSPEMRTPVRRDLALRGVKLLGFLTGAFVAAVVARQFAYAAFLLPAVVVACCGVLLAAAVSATEKETRPKAPVSAQISVQHHADLPIEVEPGLLRDRAVVQSSSESSSKAVPSSHSERTSSSVPSLVSS